MILFSDTVYFTVSCYILSYREQISPPPDILTLQGIFGGMIFYSNRTS